MWYIIQGLTTKRRYGLVITYISPQNLLATDFAYRNRPSQYKSSNTIKTNYNRTARRPVLQIGKRSCHSSTTTYDGGRHLTLSLTPYIDIRINNLPGNTLPS